MFLRCALTVVLFRLVAGWWQCHHYVGDQEVTNWCRTATYEEGFEYMFTEGALNSPCFPCWCCKRSANNPNKTKVVAGSTAVQTTAPTVSPMAQAKNYTHHAISIAGLSTATLVGEGGAISGDELTIQHNSGFTLFSSYHDDTWKAEGIDQLQLMGKAIKFTVDLSQVGCACNLAFYLVASPARDLNGQLSRGAKRDGQPAYYCDANDVGGQWCPEVDIMEANTHAFQATPHKCDAAKQGHYNYCDRGGCSQNTREKAGAYGPGMAFTIDTQHPFDVSTEFIQDSAKVLVGMKTILIQADRKVVLHHSTCSADYLAQLSTVMTKGMSLRITYWGDGAETMQWMDAPPCGPQSCGGENAGKASIRNMSIAPLPIQASISGSGNAAKPIKNLVKHAMAVQGLPSSTMLVGSGGSISDDRLTIHHNSGFSLFSKYKDDWNPKSLTEMKLVGKSISFDVDMSQVGCACNLAFYLISSPARDVNGDYSRGTSRDGQPPFYCDANDVGGQWCPEVDIMEANSHVFASTPHKCNPATKGHYDSCDRFGCGQNTRDEPDAYGPGRSFKIDTTKPFQVRTEFPAGSSGMLNGMRTVLLQAGSEVTLAHTDCTSDYLAQLSGAMEAGMSLRITYWGDRAETMSWLDAPPCGQEACTGTGAGDALIHNLTIAALPTPADVWIVSDPESALDGQALPESIMSDPSKFQVHGDHGIAFWKGHGHFVKKASFQKSVKLNTIMREESVPLVDGPVRPMVPLSPIAFASIAGFVCLALFATHRSKSRRGTSFQRVPGELELELERSVSGLDVAMMEAAFEEGSSSDSDVVVE